MTGPAGLPWGFGLADAASVALVGSRVDGTDYPGSDVDYLAIFADDGKLPAVDRPGAQRMVSTLGESWTVDTGGTEINVERVRLAAVRQIGGLLDEPPGPGRFVSFQPYELRLLDRLRSAQVLTGAAAYAALRDSLPLERLAACAFVASYHAAQSHLALVTAALAGTDPTDHALMGTRVGLVSAAYAIAAAAASLHDQVIPMVKKMPRILRNLAGKDPAFLAIEADVTAVVTAGSPADAVRAGQECLATVRRLASQRAAAGEPWWPQACQAV